MVVSEEAEEMRNRARDLGEMAKRAVEEGGSSWNDLNGLVEELRFRRSSTRRHHSRVFQASTEGPLFIFIISNNEALSMLKLNEDVVGDSKARVSEQMGEIQSAVEMAQLKAKKKHDEVVDEMLAMLNAKAEASRLKEVEQEVGKDVDEEQ
ncbi:UDP-glycosyltransferase 73B4 [Camellia lanceoleosa]|uniref:UDP-glycosyltransferase 73B4 n=1 Tax=Camellia lanceoleosa TaxID=1840588 RepID=A0ACC0HPJ4_9ERIC|nr:UDP-glycosyltransferase 73B4 [Camellia lanceoleosa]